MQVSWDDIGGLDKLKKQLQDIVANLKLDPEAEQTALSRAQPRGVLLFGPPGCSKTMLARAMAAQGGLNFLHIRGTDIYSKYVGESEKAIARAFARARQAAPSVLFIDEIDTVTHNRDQDGGHGAYLPIYSSCSICREHACSIPERAEHGSVRNGARSRMHAQHTLRRW